MTLPTIFATLPAGNASAALLDTNFSILEDAIVQPITATGSANAYVLTPVDAWATGYTLYKGNALSVIFPASNTGATSVNVSGLGPVNLYKNVGGVATALATGDIYLSVPYLIICDGSDFWLSALTVGAATTASAGAVQLATLAEVKTGTNATKAVTPSTVLGALGFSSSFTWTGQVLANAGASSTAHGLGRLPVDVTLSIVCISADAGYAVGDSLVMPFNNNGGGLAGVGVYYDATTVGYKCTNTASGPGVPNKGTGAGTNITWAKWTMSVYLGG